MKGLSAFVSDEDFIRRAIRSQRRDSEAYRNRKSTRKELAGKKRDEETNRCTVQRGLFEKFMVAIIQENRLVDITDQILAFTLVTSFIDYIKTLQYEAYSGLSDTVSGGWLNMRNQLNRLIQQNMRALAVDRKTKLFYKEGGQRITTDKDLSLLLTDPDAREYTAETRSMSVTSVKRIHTPKTFTGVDGEQIIDQEVDLDNDTGE